MKITEHIKKANGKTLFSFEIIPPKKGKSIQELYDNIDPLMEFKSPFIDVTTSREEYVYIEKEGFIECLNASISKNKPRNYISSKTLEISLYKRMYHAMLLN